MNSFKNKNLSLLVLAAMFAAMSTAMTFFIKIPMPGGGYIHPGDSIIYLAACFLPTPYAMLSAGIGGALSDMFGGYFVYIIPTFIIKALIALPFSRSGNGIITKRNALMVIPSGLITIGGYYITKVLLLALEKTSGTGFLSAISNPIVWASAAENIPENSIQAVGSAVIFFALAFAFDKANLKIKLTGRI